MKKFQSRFIVIVIFALILTGVIAFLGQNKAKLDQSVQANVDLVELVNKSSEIQRLWWEGEESEEWSEVKENCLKLYKVNNKFDESILRCNPILLICANKFSKKWNGKLDENISLVSALQEKGGGYFIKVLGKNSTYLNLLLKNNCHETYLEEKVYAYGEEPAPQDGDDYLFDTINQKVYLDKHLVTKQEYQDYLIATNRINKEIFWGDDLFHPITNITLKDMNEFCLFHGKELMNAHIFDAATFLWEAIQVNSKKLRRAPLYWSKNKQEKIESCEQVYTAECLNSKPYALNSISPSWAGVHDSLGGVMEVFKNPIEPNKNLKVSSFYLNRNSKWHKLGKRASWTGEGSDRRYFNFEDAEIETSSNEFKVGFRCMRRGL